MISINQRCIYQKDSEIPEKLDRATTAIASARLERTIDEQELMDFLNQVLHGDCLEVMKQLPDCCVDSAIVDPPYGLTSYTPQKITETLQGWLANGFHEIKGSGFMGRGWDASVPPPIVWKEVFRALKPGGIALVFAGTRTVDLMGLSLRLAGFNLIDTIDFVYGSGMPKAQDISDMIRKQGLSDIRDWNGWKTASLKPAHEPILVCQRPISEKTIAANILKWGVSGINVDVSRVRAQSFEPNARKAKTKQGSIRSATWDAKNCGYDSTGEEWIGNTGRFPSNFLMSHCPECECLGEKRVKGTAPGGKPSNGRSAPRGGLFGLPEYSNSVCYTSPDGTETTSRYACLSYCPNAHTLVSEKLQSCPGCGEEMTWACPVALLDEQTKEMRASKGSKVHKTPVKSEQWGYSKDYWVEGSQYNDGDDSANASRFFQCFPPEPPFTYQTKASKSDRTMQSRVNNTHPTVKGQNLLRFLARLVTPPNGVILDCFAGSGSTAIAALSEGFNYILIEQDLEYCEIARQRIQCWHNDHKNSIASHTGDPGETEDTHEDLPVESIPEVVAIEQRVEWLETQVKANRRKIKKIEEGDRQLGLFDVG